MKVVLLEDVKGQGSKGSVVEVSAGYARFLLTNNKAKEANESALQELRDKKSSEDHKLELKRQDAISIKNLINGKSITFHPEAGPTGVLHEAINSSKIAEMIKNKYNIEIDKRKISLIGEKNNINTFGRFETSIQLFPDVIATIFINITEKGEFMEDFISLSKSLMDKAFNYLIEQYKLLKVGRPNPAILDKVFIDYYGTKTPLNQVASISVEARSMVVKPWDASILNSIDKEIQKENLGITPQNDGDKIRINFPPLTFEEREKVSKKAAKIAEDTKVSIRNIRQDIKTKISNAKKNKEINDDEAKSTENKLQDVTNSYNKKIDSLKADKVSEIMEV